MTTSRLAVLLLLFASVLVHAQSEQQSRAIKVGVAVMQNTSTRSVSGSVERDRLVREFASGKKKKKDTGAEIVAVPLKASTPDEAGIEARDQGCDYVLYTELTELWRNGDAPTTPRPGTITLGSDPLNRIPTAPTKQEEFYRAVVEYRLVREGEVTPRLASSSTVTQAGDELSVVSATLGLIANRVKEELRSSRVTGPQ